MLVGGVLLCFHLTPPKKKKKEVVPQKNDTLNTSYWQVEFSCLVDKPAPKMGPQLNLVKDSCQVSLALQSW